ncbi:MULTISPECIES: DUF4224 domain-containing protein [Nitrosomonas]|nr:MULTISPECIES: DUF4224 domain-containing protein [Nitrosomonas]UVS62583.1 DUF4224 domain-containing protein [Nitrosomonas sp. PLL12]
MQIEFLRDRGIAFIVNGAGRPIVAKTAWTGQPAPQINKKWQPNFAG